MAREHPVLQLDVNEGLVDRASRIVLATAILALTVNASLSLWALLGFFLLVTGVAGYCPLYAILDFSTVGTPHRIKHA